MRAASRADGVVMTISTKKATLLAAADTQQVLEDAIHAAHSFASQRWQADSQLLFQLAAQRLDANFPGRSACLGLAACPDLLADAVTRNDGNIQSIFRHSIFPFL